MSEPSLRQKRLASVLRRLREQEGMSAQDVARAAGLATSSVTRVEQCKVRPTVDLVRRVAEAIGTEGRMTTALIALVQQVQRNERGALQLAKSTPATLAALLAAEIDATEQRFFSDSLLPGLAQTEAYARATIRAGSPYSSPADIDARVQLRIQRQQRLIDRQITVRAIVGEEALLRPVGGHAAMAEQLDHLLSCVDNQAFTLQVIPLDLPDHPALGTGFELLTLDAWEYAYIDSLTGGVMIENTEEIATFRMVWESLVAVGLDPESSKRRVRDAATTHGERA